MNAAKKIKKMAKVDANRISEMNVFAEQVVYKIDNLAGYADALMKAHKKTNIGAQVRSLNKYYTRVDRLQSKLAKGGSGKFLLVAAVIGGTVYAVNRYLSKPADDKFNQKLDAVADKVVEKVVEKADAAGKAAGNKLGTMLYGPAKHEKTAEETD